VFTSDNDNGILTAQQSSLLSVCLLLSCFPAIPSPSISPALHNMPRERPRMGCRRGNSHGRASRQPSSTTSDPSFDASEFSASAILLHEVVGVGEGGILEPMSMHINLTRTLPVSGCLIL